MTSFLVLYSITERERERERDKEGGREQLPPPPAKSWLKTSGA